MSKKNQAIRATRKPADKKFLKFLKDAFKNESTGLAKDLIDELDGYSDFVDTDDIFSMYDYYLTKQPDKVKRQNLMIIITFYNRFFGEDISDVYHVKSFQRARARQPKGSD